MNALPTTSLSRDQLRADNYDSDKLFGSVNME